MRSIALLLSLTLVGGCAHQGRYTEQFDAGGTARLQFVLAQQEGPFDEDEIRVSFTAGLQKAQLGDRLPVKLVTTGRADKGHADVQVRLGPAAIWDGEGAQIIDLPVKVAVIKDDRVLWRFDLPCSQAGYFVGGLTDKPPSAPARVQRRHKVAVGTAQGARPTWNDDRSPFITLGSTCGEELVKHLNTMK